MKVCHSNFQFLFQTAIVTPFEYAIMSAFVVIATSPNLQIYEWIYLLFSFTSNDFISFSVNVSITFTFYSLVQWDIMNFESEISDTEYISLFEVLIFLISKSFPWSNSAKLHMVTKPSSPQETSIFWSFEN